jgi:hypothetical protein
MAAGGGAGSTATTTGEGGAGASAPDAAKGGGSGGGARALLGLGANQAAPNVARNAVPPGGLGVGLGSLAGLAGAGGPGESSSSNLDAGGGASGLALSSPGGRQEPSGGSAATSSELEFEPLVKDPNKASAPIDVPFEIVVACGPDGLVVHPGGYRITARSLKEHRGEKLLIRQLAAVALQRAQTDPGIRPKPRVKFLVENNGASTFWEARRQVLFAGLNWPMTLQVAGAQSPRLLDKEAW